MSLTIQVTYTGTYLFIIIKLMHSKSSWAGTQFRIRFVRSLVIMEHSRWRKTALLRLSLMIVAISVSVLDYIVEGNCPDRPKYYRGSDTFAGRLKCLTYITMVQTITIK